MVRLGSFITGAAIVASAFTAGALQANGLKLATETMAVDTYAGVLSKVMGAESEAAGIAILRTGMAEAGLKGAAIVATAESLYGAIASGTKTEKVLQFITDHQGSTTDEFSRAVVAEFGAAKGRWVLDSAALGYSSADVQAALSALPAIDMDSVYTIVENKYDPSVAPMISDAVYALQAENCTTQSCDAAAARLADAFKAASLAPEEYRETAITVVAGMAYQGDIFTSQLDEGAVLTSDLVGLEGISDAKTGDSVDGPQAIESAAADLLKVVDGKPGRLSPGKSHCVVNGQQTAA